ncbi:MAG: DUF3794 domain-containing protein [Lachnospiraceae bacterium]|nr:DUF3794 domain-containing protein [Lachnospiraceae bacterium]
MDFCRKDIHTNILKASKYSQLTIDEDFNITDTKEDIEKIIAKDGYIVVEEVSCEDNRVKVIGEVYFKVLYKTVGDKPDIEVYEGNIPFEDQVNVDGVVRHNFADSQCRLEDITVSMINSRKLEVRGLIGNSVCVYEDIKVNATTDLENGQGIECLYKKIISTDTVISKKDVCKIKEEIDIPQNKPNIKNIIWSSVELRSIETKPLDNKISIRGEVEIFVVYKGQEEHLPIQYLFSVRSISREMECMGAKEGMMSEVDICLGKGDVNIRGDKDGEDRIIAVEYNMDMNIKMYEEQEIQILSDMFSPQVEILPETAEFSYENLILRNQAKAKINHRKRIPQDQGKLLQICHVYGSVDVDDVNVEGETVHITGVVKTNILYISAGEDPMNCTEIELPFEYGVDAVSMGKEDSIRIIPSLDQLNATMLSSEEIEIKAQVNLGISIFSRGNTEVITDMKMLPIDYEKKSTMPGIVGYIVKQGDTIWSIARKYYATTESIRSINNLENDDIREGDRLIIVKS